MRSRSAQISERTCGYSRRASPGSRRMPRRCDNQQAGVLFNRRAKLCTGEGSRCRHRSTPDGNAAWKAPDPKAPSFRCAGSKVGVQEASTSAVYAIASEMLEAKDNASSGAANQARPQPPPRTACCRAPVWAPGSMSVPVAPRRTFPGRAWSAHRAWIGHDRPRRP